jgi:hypothetical protein
MIRKVLVSACAVVLSMSAYSYSFAEEKAPTTAPAGMTGAPTPEQQAEMMKAWEAYAKPGPHHEKFAKMEGKWTVNMEDYSAGGDKPMTFQGESEFELILGGRYLVNEYEGSMMGQKFEGMGISAYDNIKKKYVDIWIDNMGTGVFTSEGEENDKGDIIYTGKMTMPGMGEMTTKHVVHDIDADTHTFTMYNIMPDGTEQKMIHMTYKRKK